MQGPVKKVPTLKRGVKRSGSPTPALPEFVAYVSARSVSSLPFPELHLPNFNGPDRLDDLSFFYNKGKGFDGGERQDLFFSLLSPSSSIATCEPPTDGNHVESSSMRTGPATGDRRPDLPRTFANSSSSPFLSDHCLRSTTYNSLRVTPALRRRINLPVEFSSFGRFWKLSTLASFVVYLRAARLP